MSDKIIIKTISAIYFSMVSFLVFILLLLTSLFIVLKNGLYLDEINLPNLKVEQLYIKWNEKLDFSIKEIKIVKSESKSEKINYKDLSKYLNKFSLASNFFNSITIEKIQLNQLKASFKYNENENGFFIASSKDFSLEAQIYFKDNYLNINLNKFHDNKRKIDLNGSFHFDVNSVCLYSKLYIDVNKDVNVILYTKANQNKLSYKLESLKNIQSLKHLIELVHLPKEVRYWALDAIDMKDLTINTAYGFVDFDNTDELLKNIYISATVNSLNYTYNQDLDAIHTAYTELEFKEGIFYIRPKEAYSYKQFLDKSWLKIDFTKKEELLTLNLLFDGILNKDMLKILNTYKIKLPFLQNRGKVTTNLIVKVGLRNIDIDAKGDFYVKEGNFDYLNLNIDVNDAKIKLNNYDVVVKNMHVKYADIANSDVDVQYNASTTTGTILFRVTKVHMDKIELAKSNIPLQVSYKIQKQADLIEIKKSQWIVFDKNILNIEAIEIPFDLDNLLLTLPTTQINVKDIASAYIQGTIDIKNTKANLNADLLSFKYSQVKLDQSNARINIVYDEKLSVSAKEEVLFDLDGTAFKTSNLLVEILDNVIDLKHTGISIGNYLTAKITARYDEKKKIELVRVKNLKIKNNDKLLYKKSRLVLKIKNINEHLIVSSKEIDTKLDISANQWTLNLNSLENISRGSTQLKQLKITDGSLVLTKKSNEKTTKFSATIQYPYEIFIKDDKHIKNYTIKGNLNKEKIHFQINDIATINVSDNIKINIKDVGINIDEVIKLVKDINTQTSSKSSKNLSLTATNSYLDFGQERKAISDSMSLQYFDKVLTAQLRFNKGLAGFKLSGDTFHLYGKDFDDKFMEKLFTLSKFQNGTLDFSMSGSLEKYDGVFYIHDTLVVDYIILNNILAFINTIPSLTTFSIPGYNKKGLLVTEAYMKFSSNKGKFDISDFLLESPEISITGMGTTDVNKDTIDVDLTLKTDLGSSTSKIPLVGYIVLGKDNISTGVRVSGKLSDPKITPLIIQDIVVAPINIIKRTLLLPYKLLMDLNKDKNSSK